MKQKMDSMDLVDRIAITLLYEGVNYRIKCSSEVTISHLQNYILLRFGNGNVSRHAYTL